MKKIFFAICFGAMAFGVGSAQAQRYTIEGRAPASENGKTVYMYGYVGTSNLDSTVVRDGKFTFVRSDSGIRRLDLGRYSAQVIAEPGTITVDLEKSSSAAGTPLNDSLTELRNRRAELRTVLEKLWSDTTLNQNEKRVRMQEVNRRYTESVKASYRRNKDNNFGVFALWDIAQVLEPQEFIALMDAGGAEVKGFLALQYRREGIEALLATEAGKPFVDFEGTDSTGRAVKLSDYVGRGKYVLVDFWASWCGPCRQETPFVAQVYEKYKDKGLEVLGLFVWDQPKNLGKAVKDLGITWPQLIDSNSEAGKLYGVQGIPHLILFGPDGTILARDLRGPRIEQEIAKHIR